jgi:anaerobic selenocysteine-containing dehydrogenase
MEIFQDGDKLSFKAIQEDWQKSAFVCSKMKVYAEREINNGIKSWQKLNGKRSEFADENQAIEKLSEILKEYKNKKILYMRGSGSLAYNMGYWDVFMSQFADCYNMYGNPCDATGDDAHEEDFGTVLNPDINNMKNADCIIIFGKNAAVCSQHLFAHLKEMKKDGKKIIYIDPVKTKTAEIADKYIPIKPAYDGVLAYALLSQLGYEKGDARELLAMTGLSSDNFRYLLDNIVPGKTAIIEGYGLQRQENGKNAIQWLNRLASELNCLDMLYFGHGSKRFWKSLPKEKFAGSVKAFEVAEELLSGDFDLFICVGSNPAITFPDSNKWKKALSKVKTVVVDTNEGETSEYADFFLKVGGMFSQADVMGSYFFPHKNYRDKFTKEMSDTEAVTMLSEKLGMKVSVTPNEDIPEKVLEKRKYNSKELEVKLPEKSDKFQLMTSSHHAYLNSQYTEKIIQGLKVIYINRDDASDMDIKDGDSIKVFNGIGEFEADAVLTDGIVRKSVMCWKNIPMKKGYLNCVIPSRTTDFDGGINYYTTFVDIEKV